MSDEFGHLVDAAVRMVEPGDESVWVEFYAGIRGFCRLADERRAVATAWQWLRDGEYGRGMSSAFLTPS